MLFGLGFAKSTNFWHHFDGKDDELLVLILRIQTTKRSVSEYYVIVLNVFTTFITYTILLGAALCQTWKRCGELRVIKTFHEEMKQHIVLLKCGLNHHPQCFIIMVYAYKKVSHRLVGNSCHENRCSFCSNMTASNVCFCVGIWICIPKRRNSSWPIKPPLPSIFLIDHLKI